VRIVHASIAVVALHTAMDAFLASERGTSWRDHIGVLTLWRSRKRAGHRFLRRGLIGLGAALGVYWILTPVAVAIFATHRPREAIEPLDLGRPHEQVTVRTSDGLELDGR
jgi:hypothetical protein